MFRAINKYRVLKFLLSCIIAVLIVSPAHADSASSKKPVLIRIFKQEHELELWEKADDQRYKLVNTYTICKFSGHLGPKLSRGDKQAPEGFYEITPSQLRHEHRMDIGYPNKFDRQNGRTGSDIQIHGGCSSIGCFAITDNPIIKVYSHVQQSFRSGQRIVQIQSYPFRMTDDNMKKYSSDKNFAFWQQLKIGYDQFEENRHELVVSVIAKQYIIN